MQARKKKRPLIRKPLFWTSTAVAAALVLGWWLWQGLYQGPHRLHYVLVAVNGEPRKVLPGETLNLHPHDRVRILDISTNIPLNMGIRLVADTFDVTALRYEEMPLSRLLPGDRLFAKSRHRVLIKRVNEDLGEMLWQVQPLAEDWLDKVNRTLDPKRKVALLLKALESMPEDRRFRRRLIDEYKALGRWRKAAQLLEQAAANASGPDEELLEELLEAYEAIPDEKGILSVLKRLVKVRPDDLELRSRLAELLDKGGDAKAAIRAYRELLARIRIQDSLSVLKRLGFLLSQVGRYKEAARAYEKAARLDDSDPNIYYNLAFLYSKTKQKKRSLRALETALKLAPADVEGRIRLAEQLLAQGDPGAAERYLRQVLKKKPKSLPAVLLLMKALEKQGKKSQLKSVYRRVLALDPKNDTVLYNLGALEYETGRLKECVPYFQRYLKAHPQDADVHAILYEVLRKLGRIDSAYEHAVILARLRPKEADVYDFLFEYLAAKNRDTEILKILKRAIKANPEDVTLREYLVVTYLKLEQNDAAVVQMREILKRRPKDVDLRLSLARLLEKEGRIREAAAAYREVIELFPGHEEAEDAYLRLRLQGVKGGEKGS